MCMGVWVGVWVGGTPLTVQKGAKPHYFLRGKQGNIFYVSPLSSDGRWSSRHKFDY